MKLRSLYIFFVLSICLLPEVQASVSAPYTEPALRSLNVSAAKIGTYVPPVGATEREVVKSLVKYYASIYNDAGYNFEKSLIQLSTDLNKDPEFFSKGAYYATPAVFTSTLADQLNEMRSKAELSGFVEQAVSKETVKALNNIRAIRQRQAAANKAKEESAVAARKAEEEEAFKREEQEELAKVEAEEEQDIVDFQKAKEAIEKSEKVKAARAEKRKLQAKQQKELEKLRTQSLLNTLSGHYENQQGKSKRGTAKTIGTLDVKVVSPQKATFSLYNNLSAPCKIDNGEAIIQIEGDDRVKLQFGDHSEARRNRDACAMTMTLKEASDSVKERMGYDYSIEIDQAGCRSYCDRGGTMLGRYIKTE